MNKYIFPVILFLLLFLHLQYTEARTLVHPGISHKISDLDRMKTMVRLGKEPWKTAYANLQASAYASYNYTVKWSLDSTRVVEGLSSNYEKFKYDALACYYNALQWYISGDARYAEKSIEILNKMKNIRSIVSGTQSLAAGRVLPKLLEGAEIIKSTYTGWKQDDIKAFQAMLVYPGYSRTVSYENAPEHSFYWAMYNGDYGRHGNQGLLGMLGTIQIAIFSDNEIMYDRIIRYMKGEKHRSDDLPYVSGPTNVNSGKNISSSNSYFDDYSINGVSTAIKDYGYNEVIQHYIWENGQTQEASRDQGHSQLALGVINNICEIAWNQGDDLYGFLDNRLLLGWEYYFKYNLSFYTQFNDQLTSWEPTVENGQFIQKRDRSQRWLSKKINPWNANDTTSLTRGSMFSDKTWTTSTGPKTPMYSMALGHYKSRMNFDRTKIKWLSRADSVSKKLFGYERQGFQVDYLGYGQLTFQRIDSCQGDPVTFVNKQPVFGQHKIPCLIEAEDYDYFSAFGNGKTYFRLVNYKAPDDYRNDSVFSILSNPSGGYKITDLRAGDWLKYSITIPEYAKYKISLKYKVSTENSRVKLRIGSQFKSGDIVLTPSNGDNWSECILMTDTLLSGIRSMQVMISGETSTLEIDAVNIQRAMVPAKNDYVSFTGGNYNTASNWRLSDGAGGLQSTVPASAPSVSTNVWIDSGHQMTAAAVVNAKNLVIGGTLIVGANVTSTYDINLGSTVSPGNLYVLATGRLSSTTPSEGKVSTIRVYGDMIQVDGQLGSADSITTAGSGFRIYCENEKTTISGNGKINISRIQSGLANTLNQEIIVDADVNLMNSVTSGASLSLLNGDAGFASKKIIINKGRKVNFTGGSSGLLHQMSSSTAQSTTGGNMTYQINGLLNTGAGGLYFTTSTNASALNQQLNLNVGSKGKLVVGPKLIMIKSKSTQNINFNFDKGSEILFNSSVPVTFSSTAVPGVEPAKYPANFSNLTINQVNGLSLKDSIWVSDTLKFIQGSLILGPYNLYIDQQANIIGADVQKHIVTDQSGKLIQSVFSGVNKIFPVGVSANRFDPVTVLSAETRNFAVKVDTTFKYPPLIDQLINPVIWNISSNLPSKAIFTLHPSILLNSTDPVIGSINNNKWFETAATFTEGDFIIESENFNVIATGSAGGFGVNTDIHSIDAGFALYRFENKLFLNSNVSKEYLVEIFSLMGQKINSSKINTGNCEFILPDQKMIYLVTVKSDTFKYTSKY